MRLFQRKTNKLVKAKNARQPKFSSHGGRSWDSFTIFIMNESVEVHLDTTWGHNGYFEWDGRWYSVNIWEIGAVMGGDLWRVPKELKRFRRKRR